MSRPEGAFTPEPPPPPNPDAGFQPPPEGGAENPPPPMPDGGPPPPPPPIDAGGSTGGSNDSDSGVDAGMTGPDEADKPYLAITGRYYMRGDIYNVGTVKQVGLSLRLGNTATYFSVMQLDYDIMTNKLKMTERLCNQMFLHECQEGCDSWKTEVDARTTPLFPYVERAPTLANGVLTAPMTSALYGFDGKTNPALPQSETDARVWNIVDGEDVREGVFTSIEATGISQLNQSISCTVYNVQRFNSAFAATLSGGKLDGVSAPFDTKDSSGYRVGAGGRSASSCRSQDGTVVPGPKADTIRFYKVPAGGANDGPEFWNCPKISVFQQVLPPK